MGKRLKNLGNRSRKKKKRNLVGNYLGSLQPNYFIDRDKKNMRKKEKRDGMKIGVNGKFLKIRNLEGGPYYESPKKKITSYAFE